MGSLLATSLLLCHLLLLLSDKSFSLPLCTNSRAPSTLKTPLKFCPYNGTACCDSAEDLQLQKQFQAMNISDLGCASLVKAVLCSFGPYAECLDLFSNEFEMGRNLSFLKDIKGSNPGINNLRVRASAPPGTGWGVWAAALLTGPQAAPEPTGPELYIVNSDTRSVPVLCNSTVSANSSQSNQAADNFCSDLWDTCQTVPISNSPFAPPLVQSGISVKSNVSKLTDVWQSKADFCNAFGGASSEESVCFDGGPVTLNNSGTPGPASGLCLEKIGNGSYLNMVAHPDGSNRAFFSSQEGKIWLATIPEEGSGGTLGFDESSPFVDLTDEVHFDTGFGMMGMAFHPNFTQNGRFFASFNCDKAKWPG
ncbi:hypothetical protein TIFTF001_014977, partial [Ficus carica]